MMLQQRNPRFRWPFFAAAAWLLVMPRVASAHLVTTGLGPIYDGVGHLVMTVDDLIPVIGIALLAGLQGPEAGRRVLFTLPIAWFIGGMFGLRAPQETTFPFYCGSFLLLGVLIATNLRLPPLVIGALSMIMGLCHGFADGSAIKDAGVGAAVLEFIGIVTILFVIQALVAAFVVWLRWEWTRIAVRVAGSWIAAMGLLLLGWVLHTAK